MGQRVPDEYDDIIDSRDLIERRQALEDEIEEALDNGWISEEVEFDDYEELEKLREVCVEGEGIVDFDYGATLIRETYFEDYARQTAEEIGAINDDAAWPCNCIDWERAARELQTDYSSIEFGNVTYYVR